MLNEYDLWFQKRRVTSFIKFPETVYSCEGGAVAAQAVKEYQSGVERLLGFSPKITKDVGKCTAFLGTAGALKKSAQLFGIQETALPARLQEEGFFIKVTENQIFIICNDNDENGLLYGVFRFLSLLTLGEIKTGFEALDAPVSPLRMINHWDNFDGSIERGYAGKSLFFKDGYFNYDSKRVEDYARAIASIGINRVSINNVNVRAAAKLLITEDYLREAGKLAEIFRRFGIKLILSINFGSPWSLGKLPTADPLEPSVASWWEEHTAIIYKYIPDLAGFIVKADSEGEPGPFQYNRTHADGANMLAKALKPFGGVVIWRCFVYNCQQDWRDKSFDRACAAYNHFKPLDGAFDKNVILQIKFGPYDFQVREPVAPLFGALCKTRHVMELQITQEYTGHQIDLCYLPFVWEDILKFDTVNNEKPGKNRIMDMVKPYNENGSPYIEGFSSVVNVGLDMNWTGHTLAQANLYGYGRMAWNPSLIAKEIAEEWCALCFENEKAAEKISRLLLKSYPAYEKYNAPFGICFMVTPGLHYGPNIEGYEFSRWGTYHRADAKAIGIDRTKTGTGYTDQYSPENAAVLADTSRCPENIILFIHRLRYDFVMKNKKTLLQNIYDTHFEGYEEAAAMLDEWKSMESLLESDVYKSVLARFERQLVNAREWRDQINTYFFRKTGIKDNQNRQIYD